MAESGDAACPLRTMSTSRGRPLTAVYECHFSAAASRSHVLSPRLGGRCAESVAFMTSWLVGPVGSMAESLSGWVWPSHLCIAMAGGLIPAG